ncbi:10416_t:CDS:2 [Funneliformis geosporum]|uniref:10416_t:CDS:1 n=1 Tax=Funneliformis geosporum TaxID=1117311 RepID=A0A9W4SRY4_9GLOM|nr:10416_t:CDS:2 [Funneliformis geosporum]
MIQENEYDICQVLVINLQNEEICCGQQFLHDGSTGNMANHLREKYDIHEKMNKPKDNSIQLTIPQVVEKAKIKPHKKP